MSIRKTNALRNQRRTHLDTSHFFGSLLTLQCLAHADTLSLKDGDVFSGKIITYQDSICIFAKKHGATLRVNTTEIKSISTDDDVNLSFASGENANGRLIGDKEKTALKSKTFGMAVIQVSDIQRITRSFAPISSSTKSTSPQQEEVYGEQEPKQPPLDFLIGSTVLLNPGQYEFDLGLAYKQTRETYSLPAAGYFQRSSYAAKQITFDATVRGGLSEGLEGWISAPVTYSYIEQVSTNDYVRDKDSWDLADISFGLQYQLIHESHEMPAISTTLSVRAPTGNLQKPAIPIKI